VELVVGPNRYGFARDVFDGTNTYLDSKGVEQSNKRSLSQELGAWMADHGVPASVPVHGEIDTIAGAITQSNQQGEFWDLLANRSDGHFDRETAYLNHGVEGKPGAFVTVAATLAVALGLAGLVVIWLRNRRRLALAFGRTESRAPATEPQAETATDRAPPSGPSVRTLSIMFSDVKDYTARTASESRLGILDLVRRHRDLAQPIVKRRGGRVVKFLGDGLLIAFESATDAVLAGLEIQAAAAAHNRDAPADRDKLELRIGVSTGEVALDGGDVFGEAVNLASRAQQQAAAGDVLFTEATFATINRREVRFDEAGTFELKGVPGAVRLFRALTVAAPASERDADTAGKPAR
jgi:class 3 adenylate cyclase